MPDEPRLVMEVTTQYWSDGSIRWKPAGAAKQRTAEDDWETGPECPIHGPWVARQRKDGSGWFWTCKVPKGEPFCKKKVSTREGTWGAENPPGPSDDFGYTSDEDLFGG
jgi:hypothetical protein